MAPSSYQELQVMMADAVALCDGPVAIRWPKTAAVVVDEADVGSGFDARLVHQGGGNSVCIIGVGKMLAAALGAAKTLAGDGIDVTVWDPRLVKPLDPQMLEDAGRHQLVVTVEDGFREGGAGTAIETALRDLGSHAQVVVLGVPVEYIPHAKPDKILSEIGLDAKGVERAVRDALA